jgi:hypothetical protein
LSPGLAESGEVQRWFATLTLAVPPTTKEGVPVRRRTKITIAVAASACALAAGAGAGVALAGGSDTDPAGDENTPAISGPDLDRASAAALSYTGQGRVTETEVGDEESYYEVEVTLDDGRQVDVQLDERFAVVGSSQDVEDSAGREGD